MAANPGENRAGKKMIEQIASVYFWLDKDLRISDSGETLKKYMPDTDGRTLMELFDVQRPALTTFAEFKKTAGAMVLLVDRGKRFAARGQFIEDEDRAGLVFVGAPWLSWITSAETSSDSDISISIGDFKAHDAQVDQLILLSTEQQNLRELKELTENLRTARDKAELAFKVQSDFFAIMSHEMRTPLNGVATALQIINSDDFSGENLKMLEIARSSSNNMKEVVDDVLNYSKLQAGGFENRATDFDPRLTIEGAIAIAEPKAKEQGTAIESRVEADLYPFVRADEPKFRQIMINLLGNAVKYCRQGRIHIHMGLSPDKQLLKLCVSDNGAGIPEEVQPHIFKSFWTRETNVVEQRGTGLGLNICKRLIDIMGGRIHFESAPDQGTKFFIEFPIEQGEPDFHRALQHKSGGDLSGQVLLVEDNQVNQYLAKLLLEKRGLNVDIAENGAVALEMVAKQHFDLILMDISMPVMDGVTATQRLRETYSSSELPIVAMTAHAGEEQAEHFISVGMNDVLHKPIDTSLLDRALLNFLRPN